MGKLNIAHHKSYHPYRRDNIEKVRRDEEEARLKEAKEEGRMLLADSEARIDLLRQKNKSSKKHIDDGLRQLASSSTATPTLASISTSGGHINFFEDLEQNAIVAAAKASKKDIPVETDKGFALAPSAKDLNPWYSGSSDQKNLDENDDRRKRDTARKSIHDPLTSINHQLASSSTQSSVKPRLTRPSPPKYPSQPPEVNARLSRESAERERALALIRRKKREMMGSETPSTVRGGDSASEYGDMYNRRDVEDAHRLRDQRWDDYRPRRRGDDYRR
ncbi:hypothetical protein C8R41DRAFT_778236 [Lentinula lateritia]|uniref:CBF1-interacting co-repressor CIR N-terminal domain-containing protein n=1 Tax=Lentinula lateritia TaxID=40482 RepID=A0ABQ8V3U0_9AGAR|nr:hypothetical protein C8R41DRAFT_778236 [Lentinula lateritia]